MHLPDPETAATWAAYAVAFVVALWRRRKQNETFSTDVAKKVDAKVDTKVSELADLVDQLIKAKEHDQARSAIMSDKINHLDARLSSTNQRIDKFEEAFPKLEDVLGKVLNTLERIKEKSLVEKPIEKSGGLVALKPKKED
jgi:uncharacterized UPF0160 family protein